MRTRMTLVIRGFKSSSCVTRLGSTNRQDCKSWDKEERNSKRKEAYLQKKKEEYNKQADVTKSLSQSHHGVYFSMCSKKSFLCKIHNKALKKHSS